MRRFSAVSTAIGGSIGGAALTDIEVASNGNSFTATTGPRTAETGLALSVNTPGGTVGSLDPDNHGLPDDGDGTTTNDVPIPFIYSNGITIAPNTAASGTEINIDVNGAGFSQLTFDTGDPTSNLAHVFLVEGVFVADSNRGVAECDAVAVVSDTELVCTLDLSADQLSPQDSTTMPDTAIDDGAYILTVVANGATDAGSDEPDDHQQRCGVRRGALLTYRLSVFKREWISAAAVVADHGGGLVRMPPGGTGDRGSHVMAAMGQDGRGEHATDRGCAQACGQGRPVASGWSGVGVRLAGWSFPRPA